MRDLHIIMPMGGLGSRFTKAGFTLPKPLISVDNMPMFMKALSSLNEINTTKRITTIIRKEHQIEFKLADRIQSHLPACNVIIIDKLTRGALETALFAKEHVKESEGVLLLDCDLWFQSTKYTKLIEESLENLANSYDGILTYFQEVNPRYSYVEIKDERALRTAEKQKISTNALVGSYFFKNKKTFFNQAELAIKEGAFNELTEYYTAPLYNNLIKNNLVIGTAAIDQYYSFGTPEELERYENR